MLAGEYENFLHLPPQAPTPAMKWNIADITSHKGLKLQCTVVMMYP